MVDATVTRTTPPRTVTQHSIQWGNVVKGAAIITAIVVVGIVSYGAASGFLASTAGAPVAGFLGGVVEAVSAVGGLLWQGVSFIGGAIAQGFATLFPNIAAASTVASAAPAASGTANIGGWIAALGAGGTAIALSGAHHQLADAGTHLIAPEQVHIPGHTQVVHQGHPDTAAAHHTTEIGAKNAEITSHAISHDERRSTTSNASASWANRVPAQAERRPVAPRSEAHATAVTEDRAHAALAEAVR